MIFEFLEKQNTFKEKLKVTKIMINSLHISEKQKALYIDAIDILDEQWIDKLYNNLSNFIKKSELKDFNDISKNNYSSISWLRKKQADEKTKDINSFSFLISNL